jgi:hypothetical protein
MTKQNIPPTPQELIKSLPNELKNLLFSQWKAKQNPKWHPEGNTLKHIVVVVKRAYEHYPDDPNMIMAALFHDLGKVDTYKINPKTGQPTAYGHEDVSTDYVETFRDWIDSYEGTDIDEIKYLVKNHMKVKPSTWDAMRDTKKEPIQKHPAFNKLMGFTDNLDGGGMDIRKNIKEAIKEVVNENEESIQIKRRLHELPKYIREAYYWLDPRRFFDFDEFIQRVIFSTVRDFTNQEMEEKDYDKILELREKLKPMIEKFIMKEFRDEIYEYYVKNTK